MLQRYLLLWLTLSSGFALIFPRLNLGPVDPFLASKVWLGSLVCLTMFCVGTLLPRQEVIDNLKRWPLILAGTSVQYTAMPFLAWSAATLFGLSDDLKIGVIFVGCVPGAMASNVLTIIARGNVSYSVGLTTLATLLSPLVVPLAIKLALGADADPALLLNTAYQLCWQVVAPVVIGFLLCQCFPTVQSLALRWSEMLANLAILWIIAVVVAMNRTQLTTLAGNVFFALLFLNLAGYVAGEVGGRMFGLTPAMRRALVIEVGMQNAGLGASLATVIFTNRPEVSLPSGLYTFGCMLTGTMLANIYRWRTELPSPDTFPESQTSAP